ncbi:DUF1295 domain-containing protein [Culicoidibacter larvae]|uniref:DUF1295 domain-containing protein n=1 Tax=Culicoidibacter larvae TaxID=2579976 RepID=A0A5R8QEK0_9FIRM|nr:DUF1295 domain-containing protein [Culicoidibacter larvae]TLG75450.1 DUF1295 domain-containing protein [Culicoidibacter larvae]
MNTIILISWLTIAIYFSIFLVVGNILKNNSIVDIGWGAGFVVVAITTLLVSNNFDIISIILTILVSVWGIRLSYHLFKRNAGKGEDYRYIAMRKRWGKHQIIGSFINVYLMQAIMMALVSYGYVYGILQPDKVFSIWTVIGLIVWGIGILFEVVGDRQLRNFIANNNGKEVLDTGLWKYTRHPNYFGEATSWWGIFIIVLGSTGNILAIISPIVITVLVRFISGVPLLEKKMMQQDAYKKYAEKTSVFFPLPPKNKGGNK